MNYKIVIDEKKLFQILSPLSRFCRSRIRFFEDRSLTYLGDAREPVSFCQLLARYPKTCRLCTECNEAANARCRKGRHSFSYLCHAGLIEIICPVWYKDIYVGNLSFGQFRRPRKPVDDASLARWAELTGLNPDKIRKAYISQPLLDDSAIQGARTILELCVEKLLREEVFYIGHQDSVNRIEQYINDHLSAPLTLKEIASHAYMNPSYLSAMYHKTTGMTLSQYIHQARISRSIYLFLNTTRSIAQIAADVGFRDANYFSRIFGKRTGMTPTEYRKQIAAGRITP